MDLLIRQEVIKSSRTRKIILINKNNSGHGPTVTFGYNKALKLKPKYIFQVDSDDQFYASDFTNFWKKKKSLQFYYWLQANEKQSSP